MAGCTEDLSEFFTHFLLFFACLARFALDDELSRGGPTDVVVGVDPPVHVFVWMVKRH